MSFKSQKCITGVLLKSLYLCPISKGFQPLNHTFCTDGYRMRF